MSMVSFPFDSKIVGYDDSGYPQYDRAVNSSVLANMLNSLATTGVLLSDTNAFSVSAGDNMLVKVHAGSAIIKGITCVEDTERTLSLQAADATYDRIDTVVLRLNTSVDVRAIDLYVVKGTASASPVAPVLTRFGSVYELGLANVYIPANVVKITNERITDTRGDSLRCGYSIFAGYDGLFSQINAFQAQLSVLKNELQAQIEDEVKVGHIYQVYISSSNSSGIDRYTHEESFNPPYISGYRPIAVTIDYDKTSMSGVAQVTIDDYIIKSALVFPKYTISLKIDVIRESTLNIVGYLHVAVIYAKVEGA